MTSSSSYELTFEQDGRSLLGERIAEIQVPHTVAARPEARGGRPVLMTLRRAATRSHLRVRVGTQALLDLPPGRGEWRGDLAEVVGEEFGEVEITVEEAAAESPEAWGVVVRASLWLQPRPGLEELFDAIVGELEAIHAGLARDLVSHTARRAALAAWAPRALHPREDLQRLEELAGRIDRALRRIGDQPSSALLLTRRRERWRPGDRTDSRAAAEIASRSGAVLDGAGRPRELGKVLVRRAEVTRDIGEHRHLREEIARLARFGDGLAEACERAARLLEEEETRWGSQVFEDRYRPRIAVLDQFAARAAAIAFDLRGTIARHEFLRDAGQPRTPFGPTPVFLGRDSYRDAYRALVEARRRFGIIVDSEGGLRLRFKSFAVLYEYWCFIRVVKGLRERFGAPEGKGGFSLVHDVYRPELTPGQSFRFRLGPRAWITATYEPDFPPTGSAEGARFEAALVTAPLRPDIVVEIEREGSPAIMLVLDAKSTRRFSRELLLGASEHRRRLSDYRGLIHDPRTGHQPVRQLFLLHADRSAPPLSNLPGYLEGRLSPRQASILGAVPCLPGETAQLERVLDRFLEAWGEG